MSRPLAFIAIGLTVALALFSAPPPVGAQQGDGPDEMAGANRAASVLLLERMKRDRPADYRRFCGLRRSDTLVVSGAYDHVEWVLRHMGTPFATITPGALDRASLHGVRTVLVNCPGRIGEKAVKKLRDFVEAGGFLFTTDWAVQNVIEPAFPETIRYTRKPTRDDVVAIEILKPEHLFLTHVLTRHDRHLWWLENQSYPVEVLDRRRVETLIKSEEMKRKYGASPVAVTFPAGRGRVVHIVSHFYLQRSELRTERDRLKARDFAADMEFAPSSPAVRRLGGAGLDGVPAGQLRSAYSAQQLLANILIEATRTGGSVADPTPPVQVDPPRPVPTSTGKAARTATMLRSGPDGDPVKPIPAGLVLRVLEVRAGWVKVATPAGEVGWVPRGVVE
jgi:hypothetical protein